MECLVFLRDIDSLLTEEDKEITEPRGVYTLL